MRDKTKDIRKGETTRQKGETIMQLNENSRFIFLTLGVFCLMLGATVLLFSLIERLFFAVHFVAVFVWASFIAIALGATLLQISRQGQI